MSDIKLHPEPTLTDEDKLRFHSAAWEGGTYEDEVTIVGNIKLKFKALTVEENELVLAQVTEDQKNGASSNTDSYLIKIASYRLGLSLVAINDKPYLPKSTITTTPEGLVLKRSAEFSSWLAIRLSAYLAAFNYFESKIAALREAVLEPGFWPAAV